MGEDAGDVPRIERQIADGIDESLVATQKADAAVAEPFGTAGGGPEASPSRVPRSQTSSRPASYSRRIASKLVCIVSMDCCGSVPSSFPA